MLLWIPSMALVDKIGGYGKYHACMHGCKTGKRLMVKNSSQIFFG